ncbi:MAG: hypothetical protein J0H36_13590 [Hyphomicrobium denitrificans]|nr:hypothetical protein [Hyphomicrobium denitrificans]
MGLTDYAKIYDLLKKLGNVEAQETIMDLREDHLRLREELQSLREENKTLREKGELAETLIYDYVYYWRQLTDRKDGPFCQVCYDNNGKLIRLQPGYEVGTWNCRACKAHFIDKNHSSPRSDSGPISGGWMSV